MFRPQQNCVANRADGSVFKFESPVRSKNNLDAYGLASSITWDLDSATFKSISSSRRQDIDSNQDFSFARFTVGNVTEDDVEFDQVSQEFNLSGTGLDNRLQWTVGAFGFYEKTRPGVVNQMVSKDILCPAVNNLNAAGIATVDQRLAALRCELDPAAAAAADLGAVRLRAVHLRHPGEPALHGGSP